MKKFLKQKFSKRLLNLLNFRRNRKLGAYKGVDQRSTSLSLGRWSSGPNDRLDKSFLLSFACGGVNQQGVNVGSATSGLTLNDPLRFGSKIQNAKASELISSLVSVPPRRVAVEIRRISTQDKEKGFAGGNLVAARLKKKKFALRSFLHSAICKFPRKYIFDILGEERPRKYYTIPYRLSFSGFICNKILKGYYVNLSHKVLFALHKKIKVRAKKSDKLAETFDLKTGPGARSLTLPQKKKKKLLKISY